MVGLGMEPQVEKFLAQHPRKDRRLVVLADAAGIKAEPAGEHDPKADHAADHDHDDLHHGADPHAWLDPKLVERMVEQCADALAAARAGEADAVKRIGEARTMVLARVRDVDARYETALGKAPRRTIVVAHDAYDYLASRYNLEVIAITGLNAGEPQPADVKKAADAVREKHLTTIFVEPQLSRAAADRIAAATGAKVAVLDPLGDGDWFALMDKNLAALKDALGVPDAPAEPKH
jgi:zinc transport system substrate-binding protein